MKDAIAEKPDFAIVSNPTSLHVKTAIQIAKANIPIFMEKPVSNNLKGLNELNKIIKNNKTPSMVGFQQRFHPGYRLFKKAGEVCQHNNEKKAWC